MNTKNLQDSSRPKPNKTHDLKYFGIWFENWVSSQIFYWELK